MKKIVVFLAIFGLINVQMAVSQVEIKELNSPTSTNQNCLLTWVSKSEPDKLIIHLFGDDGLGYVSEDNCKSWKTLDIDPILHRDILVAHRVNDTLMFISGGLNNNLLMMSTDGGNTFKDFQLTVNDPVLSISVAMLPLYMNIYFLHPERTSVMYYGFETGFISHYIISNYDNDVVKGRRLCDIRSDGYISACYYRYKKGALHEAVSWSVLASYLDTVTNKTHNFISTSLDTITGFEVWGKAVVACYRSEDSPHFYEVFTPSIPDIEIIVRKYPLSFNSEMIVNSSTISHYNSWTWHVGSNKNGSNNFLIKDGNVMLVNPDVPLKIIKDCSTKSSDEVIMLSQNGRLFSTRTDMALKTGVHSIDLNKLSVYPNPCSTLLTVFSDNNTLAWLTNINGQKIRKLNLEKGNNHFSVSDLQAGIYFITTPNNTFKFVKQ